MRDLAVVPSRPGEVRPPVLRLTPGRASVEAPEGWRARWHLVPPALLVALETVLRSAARQG